MQLSLFLSTTLLAALVSSQVLPQIPTCAGPCVTSSIPADCGADPNCICSRASFIEGISCCIFNACNTTDQEAALAYAHGVCDPTGHGDLLPAQAGCSANSTTNGTSTTSSSSSSTSSSGSASATAASSSSASSAATAAASPTNAAAVVVVQMGMGAVAAAAVGLAAIF